MPGLTDWFEVFKTGKHTDMRGNVREWTIDDLNAIAANFQDETDEAPMVVGHPEIDAPAYGWTGGLKVEGNILYAKGKDVDPEFSEMVRTRKFPNRSIALGPGLKLKHIGFLGAKAPAVKGLKSVSFSADEESTIIEFAEMSRWSIDNIKSIFRNLRDWIIESQSLEKADSIIPGYFLDEIKPLKQPALEAELYSEKEEHGMDKTGKGTPPQTFSEADLDQIKLQAKAEGKQEAAAEFAESNKQTRLNAAKARITAFCEARAREGKMLPAWDKLGLKEFMLSLDSETVIQFAEGDEGKKSQAEFMEAFLQELDKVIEFGEVATRDKAGAAGTAGDKLQAIVTAKMKAKPEMTYAAAFAEVQTENQDLAKEYQIEIGGE